jgi:two-component system CheB/CheR fusion protein
MTRVKLTSRVNPSIKTEQLFRHIAEVMPQKVWTADAEGNRTYFNSQWVLYTGMSQEELKNGGWKEIIHPDDLVRILNCWKHSLETGEDYEVEVRKRNKEGQYQWHLSRATPFP